jgi:phytoene desaturase
MKIAVIGAGMGGLAAAIRLAVAGHEVEIFEKNERAGGKLNLLEQDGFRWDTGPSLITMPFVYRQLFESAGRKLEDYVSLIPIEPVCRYFYPDGSRFDASDSTGKMIAEIERFNPADVQAYFRFMAYSRRLYDLTADVFLFKGINSWRDLSGLKPQTTFQLDPFRTVHQAVQSYFKDPRLVQLFDRYATYNGSSPFKAPATLNIIPHVELGMGGWYIQGGLYELARAYAQLAQEVGVKIHTGPDCGVAQILLKNNRACGLRLTSGAEIPADLIVTNTDVTYTYQHLLGISNEVSGVRYQMSGIRKAISSFILHPSSFSLEPSCSGFVLFLGVNRQYSQLAHHNIMFSRDYKAEFDMIFKQRQPPTDPTIYICWTGHTDPQHAPPGKSNLFVLVNAPYISKEFDWEADGAAQRYRDLIVKRMEEFGLENLSQSIESEAIMTPLDLARRYHADRGAIYGTSSNSRFSAFLRPPNRSRRYKGLYFVGGSSHPGGGVPLVTLSAKIVSDLIAEDYA